MKDDPTSAAMLKNMTWVVRIMIWAATLLFIFDNLGVNITAFVASLGIGGVAIALAAQAVLGDAFSSFAIFMDKPFQVGDFIIVGDLLGTVEHVGFKTTRIRSLGGEQLIFSNTDLTSSRDQKLQANAGTADRLQYRSHLPNPHREGEGDPPDDQTGRRRTRERQI